MTNGGECTARYYCPEGSYEMQSCTPGMYCDAAGLDAPTGFCEAGWYCPLEAASSREIVCDRGYYCPNVSSHILHIRSSLPNKNIP